jgi:hypothetical protein
MRSELSNLIDSVYWKFRLGATFAGYHTRPSFLVIGAQKCGTSALYEYLSKHPDITPAPIKEIHFFDQDTTYGRGLTWYHSHFPLPFKLGPQAICFEATPSYLYRPASAQRIHDYDPGIKLIVLLRNPVDRAYSQWNMYRIMLSKNRQLLYRASSDSDEAIRRWVDRILSSDSFFELNKVLREELEMILSGDDNPEPSYIRRGLYYEQMIRYLKYFDRDQIFVIDSRSLMRNPVSVLNSVTEFVGVSSHDWRREKFPLIQARPYQEDMSAKTRTMLHDFFSPHNEKLYQLLGHNFGWE